jgi:hypothetical protein
MMQSLQKITKKWSLSGISMSSVSVNITWFLSPERSAFVIFSMDGANIRSPLDTSQISWCLDYRNWLELPKPSLGDYKSKRD